MQKVKTNRPLESYSPPSFVTIRKPINSPEVVSDKLCIVLKTNGCSWARKTGGCTVCGFLSASAYPERVSDQSVLQQFSQFFYQNSKGPAPFSLEIYTCGSFFDENEIGEKARAGILNLIASSENISNLVVESRPEYITEKAIEKTKEILKDKDTTVAIGLETSSDFIRSKCLNKGFSFEEFLTKAKIVKRYFKLRVYIMLKPPFLTEHEALEDSIKSTNDVYKIADEIVLMPCSVQKYTLLHLLWKKKLYRPPWLWTIVEICKRTKVKNAFRVGGFSIYPPPLDYPHNCGRCDEMVLETIQKYPYDGPSASVNLQCECRKEWERELNTVYDPLPKRIDWFYKRLSSYYRALK
jgi:radical SAM enzyme (TIGR01210 family)